MVSSEVSLGYVASHNRGEQARAEPARRQRCSRETGLGRANIPVGGIRKIIRVTSSPVSSSVLYISRIYMRWPSRANEEIVIDPTR